MDKSEHADVLVVGAGPVGLYSALALAGRGIRAQVLEEQWKVAAHSYALALHSHSLHLLEQVGVAERLIEAGHRIDSIALYDETDQRAEIRLSQLGGDFPYVLVVPQQALETALYDRLVETGGSVRWNERLTSLRLHPSAVQTHVEHLVKESTGYSVARTEWVVDKTTSLSAPFVIGADGVRSTVRRLLDIEFESFGDPQQFVVFEFISPDPADHTARLVLESGLTSVFWPMGGDRFRWAFQLPDESQPEARVKSRLFVQIHNWEFPYVSVENLREIIGERAPWFRHRIQEIVWSATVRFERRLAKQFGRANCWLAGDSAHLAWPVGVQSMNIGLREASKIVELIASGVADASAFASYSLEARSEWLRLLEIDQHLSAREGADPWVAGHASQIPACIPASGPDLNSLLSQLGLKIS